MTETLTGVSPSKTEDVPHPVCRRRDSSARHTSAGAPRTSDSSKPSATESPSNPQPDLHRPDSRLRRELPPAHSPFIFGLDDSGRTGVWPDWGLGACGTLSCRCPLGYALTRFSPCPG